jgi:4-carboxymuconolactone decarboxylase
VLDRAAPGVQQTLGELHIFPTLARHKAMFRAWLPFAGFLLRDGSLPARERELLILRTARNCRSNYEWAQHVRVASALGVPRSEIDRVAKPTVHGWGELDRALLEAADELHRDAKISDHTWRALAAVLDERCLIEITILVGHYHMVAFALNSLEVALEDGLEGLPDR